MTAMTAVTFGHEIETNLPDRRTPSTLKTENVESFAYRIGRPRNTSYRSVKSTIPWVLSFTRNGLGFASA
jgi:hypothetical protein